MRMLSAFDSLTPEELSASLLVFMVDEPSRQQISNALRQLGITDVYVGVGGMDDLIQHMTKVQKAPDRLIVDISGLDKPLDALDKLADSCDPSVTVYAVGEKNDVTLYRLLLQAGISDYRYKPLTADALRSWLDDSQQYSVRQARSGKVIAVAGSRGGVGASTIAGQLARELVAGSSLRKVVFIDMDFYGGAGTTLMGMTTNRSLVEALGSLAGLDAQFLQRVLTTTDGRLFTLGFNNPFQEIFQQEPGAVSALLEALMQHFHYLVVDLPQAGGMVANEVYARSSTVCLVSDHSVHSARILASLLNHIKGNLGAPVTQVVLNNTRPASKTQVDVAEFTKAIEHPVAFTIPYDGSLPTMAEDLGQPLPANSQLSKAVARFSRTLTGEATDYDAASSWWRKLLKRSK